MVIVIILKMNASARPEKFISKGMEKGIALSENYEFGITISPFNLCPLTWPDGSS
jgi:hypothetical protein